MSSDRPAVILSIDLKILGKTSHMEVTEGEEILELTEKICKRNRIGANNY